MLACALVAMACGSSSDDPDANGADELGSAVNPSKNDDAADIVAADDTESPIESETGNPDSEVVSPTVEPASLDGYATSFDQSASSELYRFLDGEVIYVDQISANGSPVQVTDLAIAADGTIYATTFDQLLTIDPATGEASAIGSFDGGSVNALGTLADGRLLAADLDGEVTVVDSSTAAQSPMASFPAGMTSSGDIIAMPDGAVYATASDGSAEYLLAITAAGSVETVAGPLPDDIYGLMATDNGDLFGLTFVSATGQCTQGELISIELGGGGYEPVECLPFNPGGAANN